MWKKAIHSIKILAMLYYPHHKLTCGFQEKLNHVSQTTSRVNVHSKPTPSQLSATLASRFIIQPVNKWHLSKERLFID